MLSLSTLVYEDRCGVSSFPDWREDVARPLAPNFKLSCDLAAARPSVDHRASTSNPAYNERNIDECIVNNLLIVRLQIAPERTLRHLVKALKGEEACVR